MREFVIKNWIETAMAGIIALLGLGYKKISSGVKKEREEQRLMKEALLAILHDRLYQLCNEHIRGKEIDTDALKNVRYIYESYHSLGGNGTGTTLYERVCRLPIKPKEEK